MKYFKKIAMIALVLVAVATAGNSKVQAKGVSLNAKNLTMYGSQKKELKADITLPAYSGGKIVFTSSNKKVAKVNKNGVITAKNKGKHAPENFYHGLVLGLIVSMRKEYRIVSNRESGEGRYDIAIYPFDKTKDAYILEFKVLNEHREKTVQETAQNALKQIQTRNYEADLLAYGIPADHIYKLGFGFLGKKVWVVSDPPEKDEKDQVRSEWDNLRFR